MERLTFDGNFCEIAMCQNTPGGTFCETGMCSQRRVWERLKEWEDTGLTPENINELLADAKHMTELLKYYERLEEQGKMVILPCKVGDMVYFLLQDHPAYYSETNGWYISAEEITVVCTQGFFTGPIEQIDFRSLYSFADFGKTVFLTQEEAEAALKGGAANG